MSECAGKEAEPELEETEQPEPEEDKGGGMGGAILLVVLLLAAVSMRLARWAMWKAPSKSLSSAKAPWNSLPWWSPPGARVLMPDWP